MLITCKLLSVQRLSVDNSTWICDGDRERERQTDRQKDRQRERETDAQIDYHKGFRALGGYPTKG